MKMEADLTSSGIDATDYFELSRISKESLLGRFSSTEKGLTDQQYTQNLKHWGGNEIITNDRYGLVRKLLEKFLNPLVLLLLAIAVISIFFGEKTSAIIVISLAILSTVLSFIQEHHASKNAAKLKGLVKTTVTVIREGKEREVEAASLVPGDVIALAAGKIIPADARLLVANDLFISQSSLNGESFPIQKEVAVRESRGANIFALPNIVFAGSSAVSGYGNAVVVATGKNSEYGKLSLATAKVKVETAFDLGIKDFTWLMIRLIVILGVFIFATNAIMRGNIIEGLLFALAVAVGLAPEMLPMIVTVNLSKGAIEMSHKKVIVKELDAIQNFGAMDVLCTDKTGTLTLDNVALLRHCDIDGKENEDVLRQAYYNSFFQSGLANLLDGAIKSFQKFSVDGITKIGELPFDFDRKMLSVIIKSKKETTLISKGAPEAILKHCTHYLGDGKSHELDTVGREKFHKLYENYSRDGFRVLAVATRDIERKSNYSHQDEKGLTFLGFMAFLDPPKPSAKEAITRLENLGITLKILSGDNELVSRKICSELNIPILGVIDGGEVDKLSDYELKLEVEKYNIFTRLTPLQKQRILVAFQKNKHIVGFMGDGINDAPAIKTADVGISVNNATDVAKETAEIILLEKNLLILADCVTVGRKTFANVIKYIKMGASSNFGNMISMTGASLFLPFLPMLPTQVLLNNFLYDASQIAIPTDHVDPDYLKTPRPWDIKYIKEFILYLGPISSIFDFATFGVMMLIFHASPALFHTGWFVESLITQILVVHIIRTNKIPFIESKPSKTLLLTTFGVIVISLILPYSPLAKIFQFTPLPPVFFLILTLLAATYLILVQEVKNWFIRKFGYE